jgi:hypothetical protein
MCGVEGMRDYKTTSSSHKSFTGDDVRMVKFPLSKDLMLHYHHYDTRPCLLQHTASSSSVLHGVHMMFMDPCIIIHIV